MVLVHIQVSGGDGMMTGFSPELMYMVPPSISDTRGDIDHIHMTYTQAVTVVTLRDS